MTRDEKREIIKNCDFIIKVNENLSKYQKQMLLIDLVYLTAKIKNVRYLSLESIERLERIKINKGVI